jgi:hypothetical protein
MQQVTGVQRADPESGGPGSDQCQGLPVRGLPQRAVHDAAAEGGTDPESVRYPVGSGDQDEDVQGGDADDGWY